MTPQEYVDMRMAERQASKEDQAATTIFLLGIMAALLAHVVALVVVAHFDWTFWEKDSFSIPYTMSSIPCLAWWALRQTRQKIILTNGL